MASVAAVFSLVIAVGVVVVIVQGLSPRPSLRWFRPSPALKSILWSLVATEKKHLLHVTDVFAVYLFCSIRSIRRLTVVGLNDKPRAVFTPALFSALAICCSGLPISGVIMSSIRCTN